MSQEIYVNFTIQITILEIFPTLNELEQTWGEISIIFEDENTLYLISDLLQNPRPISINVNSKKTFILISLIKSNTLFATSIFDIKNGEKWLTFNYETNYKKNTTNFAKSLIDCIKIKIFCESNNNVNNIKTSSILQKRYSANTFNVNSSKKENSNIFISFIQNGSPKNNIFKNNKIKNNKLKNSFTNQEFCSYYFSGNKMNRQDMSKLDLTIRNTNNKLSNNTSVIDFNSDKNFIKENFKIIFKNRSPFKIGNSNKNLIRMNSSNKLTDSQSNILSFMNNVENNTNNNALGSKNSFYNKNKSSKQISKNKIKTTNDKASDCNLIKKESNKIENTRITMIQVNSKFQEKDLNNKKRNSINNKENKENNNKSKHKAIKSSKNFPIKIENDTEKVEFTDQNNKNNKNNKKEEEKNDDITFEEKDIFSKFKDEFFLLYNKDYFNYIEVDDLKLEFELFFEKIVELTTVYRDQIDLFSLENNTIKNDYKENMLNFLNMNKLYKKLQNIKNIHKTKNINKNNSIKQTNSNQSKNLILSKNEIDLFKLVFSFNSPENNNKKYNELKKIIFSLLSKKENQDILDEQNNEKINKWIEENKENFGKIKEIGKVRSRVIPKQQKTQVNSLNNQITNNLNSQQENVYIKKLLTSPHYVKNKI